MFILTKYDQDMENKVVVGGSANITICIDAAMDVAEEIQKERSVNGVPTGTIKLVEHTNNDHSIYYKTSESVIMDTWTIKEIPTLGIGNE